jgi:DNA-binding transcriptional LysR family regulator
MIIFVPLVALRPFEVRSKSINLCAAWPKGIESPTLRAFLDLLKRFGRTTLLPFAQGSWASWSYPAIDRHS